MDPDVARRAFEPFFTTKEVGKGTGLGLAQVYGFATQSGGVAEIESAPGLGAKVRISLPRAAPIEEGDDAKPFVSRPFIPGGVALLVEDNAPVARFGQALLEELGFEVAENAEDALRRIASRPPRIVVSDIVMPGMNGVEMARRIRAQDANLPVILTTGYSETLTDEETKIWRVLRKPYRVDELAAAVSLALAES
jgi:CheY-like chemotaxis protein